MAHRIEKGLQHLLDEAISNDPFLTGIAASLHAPRIRWSGSAGLLERDSTVRLPENCSFRIASVTKPFTAATVLRLIETGRAALHQPIVSLISRHTLETLQKGGYSVGDLTLFHLLTHTSGLSDHAASEKYLDAILKNPRHRWTRAEQIEFCVEVGRPLFPVGQSFSYSDTGYVILGEIVENLTGQPLPAAMRSLLQFERLGLGSTYFETLETPPAGEIRAHQYLVDTDILAFDASVDLYGGGGLISTTEDLNRFFRALFQGEVFEKSSTLSMALLTPPVKSLMPEPTHAPLLGVMHFGQRPCWGHGGYWGVFSYYCPAAELAFSITLNQVHTGASTRGTPAQDGQPARPGLVARIAAFCEETLRSPA